MTDTNFSINEDVFHKLQNAKKLSGYENKSWDNWFLHILKSTPSTKTTQDRIEQIAKDVFYRNEVYEHWIRNFALNLDFIWNEPSAKELTPKLNNNFDTKSSIVIGRGPSLKKHNHLKLLAESNFSGVILCTDGALINTLKAGITPEKFPNFYVVTIDVYEGQHELYDHNIVDEFGKNITGIFASLADPGAAQRAREAKIKIHWIHPLVDLDDGKKSLNYIAAQMTRVKKNHGLPGIQTGGNVGTTCWFIAWQLLKCNTVSLIGINHGYEEDTPLDFILTHSNQNPSQNIEKDSSKFARLYPKVFNPDFGTYCILDPIFQYYSGALKEFIKRSPSWLKTINSTEGGCIFGDKITSMKFIDFLAKYS